MSRTANRYAAFAADLGDRLVEAIEILGQTQSEAIEALRERLGSFAPDCSSLPFADRLPSPQAVIDANFALAEQLLAAQKSWATGLVAALQPSHSKREAPRAVK